MRFLLLALAGVLVHSTAFAQLGERARPAFHATEYLMSRPEGRQALEEFRRVKEAALLPYAGSAKQSYEVGARVGFSVYNFKDEKYEVIDFTLKKQLDRYLIWVETALLNGTVTDQHINDLDLALGQSTPTGSFDPSSGIIKNNEVIFGDPPDVDGDSKTDILLLDVRDNSEQGFYVLGFFDPRDLGATGNQKDIIYLDTNPGLSAPEIILATAAHEYQHLIMAEYDLSEHVFVNEAQSEWAELMNGYSGRTMIFLNQDGEHEQDFFEYRGETGGLRDRERGQLFTLYLSERHGPQKTGAVTRQATKAENGYAATEVLGTLDAFRSLVTDFHVANLLNNTSLGAKYGYQNQYYTSVRTSVDRTIDGRLATSIDQTNLSMKGGSVHYIEFADVTDLSFDIDINSLNPSTILAQRPYIVVRALVNDGGSGLIEQEFDLDGSPITIAGSVDQVTLVIVNVRAQSQTASPIPVAYSAEWAGTTTSVVESVSYDDGSPSREYVLADEPYAQMTVFSVPDGDEVSLDRVMLAPFFESQFSNTGQPASAPRDLELLVLDGTGGFPDFTKEIFSTPVDDPRAYAGVTGSTQLNHFPVDLSAHVAELSSLPADVYVGYGNAGLDANYLVLAPAVYGTENVSFVGDRNDNSWSRLWDIIVYDPDTNERICCDQRAIPVRVDFLVTTILDVDEDSGTLVASLSQNYPNPFTNRTVIEFNVPDADHVELSVYDLLGRRVATLANETFAPGKHRVTLDGDRLAAGAYILRLRTGTVETTRTLIRL